MDVYIVQTHEDGVLGGAITPELGKAVAEEKVDDYFGKPVVWRLWNEGTPEEHWGGSYNENAYRTAMIWVERVTLREA